MAIFNRVYCPECKKDHNVYDEKLRELNCKKCGHLLKIKSQEGNFFIEFYENRRRKREKIGTSRALAEIALSKRKVEIVEGKYIDRRKEEKIKFEDFADEYLELHSKVNNKSWKKSDEYNIARLKDFFSGRHLYEITPKMVEEFKQKRLKDTVNRHGEKGKTLKGLAPATVNRNLICLKSIFNKAIAWGKINTNPAKGVKLLKEDNKRLRYLEKEEIVKLLANCRHHLKAIVILALNTGMRRGEILNLKWRDIDFKRDVIYLLDTKNGEKREVPINEQVKTALIRTRKHPQSPYVFCKKDGSSIGDIKKSFFTAISKSGINNFRFHDLRHTFASHLVMSGVDLNTVRELMGHKSLEMTQRYSHLSPNHKKRAVDVLSKRMDTIWTPERSFSKVDTKQEIITDELASSYIVSGH